MNRSNKILAAAFVIATVTFIGQVRAADAVASPRLQATLNERVTASGTAEDKIDRSVKPVSPRLQAALDEKKTVSTSGNDPDLAHSSGILYGTARNPFPKSVELAPLK
ncbi:MAG: hypothetical protein ACYDH9_08385 [Limisphaerales bacterium]